jgi:F-type H+-transporting ATPase subunit b
LKVVSEREAVIKKGVEDARAAEASRGKAEEERRQILIKAENDARVTREKAKQAADVERGNILRDAETQRARILNDAEVRGNEEVAASLRQAEKEAARLAILASEKLIREKL